MRRLLSIFVCLLLPLVASGTAMAKQDVLVELFYSSAWHDFTARALVKESIIINHGAADEQSGVVPSDASLAFRSHDGEMNPDNRKSSLFGLIGHNTPIRITVDSDIRFSGQVVSWKPRRAVVGNERVEVKAQGTLRRLGQGSAPLTSALHRTMSGITPGDFRPIAYWPMEDSSGATLFGAAVAGVEAATFSGEVAPAAYTGAAGSSPVATLSTDSLITGRFPATTLVADGSGDTIAQIQFLGMVPSSMSADAPLLEIDVPPTGGDNINMLRLVWQDSSSELQLRWHSGNTPVGFAVLDLGANPELFDRPILFGITMFTDVVGSPGDVLLSLTAFVDGSGFPYTFDSGSWTASAVPVPAVWRAFASAGNTGWALGHMGLYTDPAVIANPNIQDNARAIDGQQGETAGRRFARLCDEEGISYTIVGDIDDTQPMGPQYPDTLLNLLEEIARTDAGIIHDTRSELGLTLRTGRSLYNQ